ncbi:hypothetical protein CBF23_013905 [Marinomonas agarivorans]|nr:hypothetical protein CBF23_013905 [Marinomonas agarivorans]
MKIVEHNKMTITNNPQQQEPTDMDTTPTEAPPKKSLTKTQKNNRRLIKLLEDRYPQTFNWQNPKPLKIGIDKEIQLDETLTQGKLKRALAAYTRSNRYKKCLESHSERIDLEGKRVKDQSTKKFTHSKTVPNKKTTVKKDKKPSKATQKTPLDSFSGYSKEERLKLKLEQLITANKPK